MRLIFISHFLTLVLLFAHTIKAKAAPDSSIYPSSVKPLLNQGATLSPTRNHPASSTSMQLGQMMGSLTEKSTYSATYFFGVQKTYYNYDLSAKEYGLELCQNNAIGLNLGWKKILHLSSWNEPYYKISLAGLYLPSEMLATFINPDRYQTRLSLGLDDFFNSNRNFKTELMIAYSLIGISYSASLSYYFSD